jgi:hypothetical protein
MKVREMSDTCIHFRTAERGLSSFARTAPDHAVRVSCQQTEIVRESSTYEAVGYRIC